ncbi:MAG: hypothetical protein GY774_10600 [Planctomycetes bacterium]|nr:hypothetical protein [Planctomycetota bacterium]
MALTKHQKFHLDAILKEQADNKLNPAKMTKLASVKKKTAQEYLTYLDGVKIEVNKIIASGEFPLELKEPWHIHDYLEKGIVRG